MKIVPAHERIDVAGSPAADRAEADALTGRIEA